MEGEGEGEPQPLPRSQYLRNIALLVVVSFCFNFLKATVADWGALYLLEGVGFTLSEANEITLVVSIGGAVGTVLSGELSDYAHGRRDPVNKAFAIFALLCGTPCHSIAAVLSF